MRFHVVGLPHTVCNKEYTICAYTAKVLNFCKMMKSLGHTVFHYGGEGSTPVCDEHITTITHDERKKWWGCNDWRKDFFAIDWNGNLDYWVTANNRAAKAIHERAEPHDFLCLIGGVCQKPIADALPHLMSVEFGVGYEGVFSQYRVFESYAHMHRVYGRIERYTEEMREKEEREQQVENELAKTENRTPKELRTIRGGAFQGKFYDAVIPNYYDPIDFPEPLRPKEDFYLFIGRLAVLKGVNIAADVCTKMGKKLIIAGQGALEVKPGEIRCKEMTIRGNIEYVGTVGVSDRWRYMCQAQAVFTPTTYIGPFEGVSVEAMLCGTPVITTDWGCYTETVPDGLAGYRCRTFGEFIWAAKHAPGLDSKKIREYAMNRYSINVVRYRYQDYFQQLLGLWDKGWNTEEYDPSDKRRKGHFQ